MIHNSLDLFPRGKKSTDALCFRALLGLMPSRTTNETSTRGVAAGDIAPIAARSTIVGPAIVERRHVVVAVISLACPH